MIKRAILLAVLVASPLHAQAPTKAQLDSVRVELVRARAFVRGAETQFTKTLALIDSLIARMGVPVPPPPADTTLPPAPPPPAPTPVPVPPAPTPPPVVTDPSVRIYAQHDFDDNSYGPFTNLAGNLFCNATCIRNQRVEVLFERVDTTSSGDRNSGIKWVPKTGAENTPFGATLHVEATFTIPAETPSARQLIDAAVAKWGLPPQLRSDQELLQRKLFYGNPGRKNNWVLKIHALHLQFAPGVGGGPPCSGNPAPAPRTLYRFKDSELFDKPQRIEVEIKRSSGVRVADGELRVWLNGKELPRQTGFCTNEDTNTSWMLSIGQQVSYTPQTGEFYSELRVVDDVIVANKRPF